LLVDRREAARLLGMSLAHFERHVQKHLKPVRTGRRVAYSIRELERWIAGKEAA
jgi:predicted DNA-binding transcriptional regulator AlpA